MRILLLTLYYSPDPAANAVLLARLAHELTALSHTVTVVTSFPHYDLNAIWPEYRGRLFGEEQRDGLRVLRSYVYVPAQKTNIVGRLLNYITFTALSVWLGLRAGKQDVILAPSPPLTIGLSAWALSRLKRIPYIYNVQDIYPDIAIRLGVLTNPLLICFFQWMERFVYARARAVTVLSEDFRRNLLAKGVPPEKIYVIPNFVELETIRPLPKDNDFARAHDLADKFVALYAGNVGLSQGLEILLDAASDLRDLPDLRILIVGNGAAVPDLQRRAADLALPNVLFLPFQPPDSVPHLYATADVSLVLLRRGIGRESVPSKMYTIMASGRPMIAAIDEDSETHDLLHASGAGLWISPEDRAALVSAIRQLRADPNLRHQLGDAARRFADAHFAPEGVAEKYHDLLTALSSQFEQDEDRWRRERSAGNDHSRNL